MLLTITWPSCMFCLFLGQHLTNTSVVSFFLLGHCLPNKFEKSSLVHHLTNTCMQTSTLASVTHYFLARAFSAACHFCCSLFRIHNNISTMPRVSPSPEPLSQSHTSTRSPPTMLQSRWFMLLLAQQGPHHPFVCRHNIVKLVFVTYAHRQLVYHPLHFEDHFLSRKPSGIFRDLVMSANRSHP